MFDLFLIFRCLVHFSILRFNESKFLLRTPKILKVTEKFFIQNKGFLGSELTVANERLKDKRHYANNWIIVPKTNRFIILVRLFE